MTQRPSQCLHQTDNNTSSYFCLGELKNLDPPFKMDLELFWVVLEEGVGDEGVGEWGNVL